MTTKIEYRISLVNGKTGYGESAWDALVDAAGVINAGIISDFYSRSYLGTWYAKNGVIIAYCEVR